MPGHTFKGMSKVHIKAIKQHFRISEILYQFEKTNDLVEFKVHLIHRKQAPLLHNTVLIVCNERAGLVAILACSMFVMHNVSFLSKYM